MLQPIGNKVLVKRAEKEKKKIVIHVSSEDDELLPTGEVIAIGEGEELEKSGIKVKDTVHFNSFAGQEIEFEDTKYLVLKLTEILAKC